MRSSAEFFSKILKFLRSLADFLAALTFLCCHYIFDSYITCLTLSFNTVHVYFYSPQLFLCLYSWTLIILTTFKSILSQSKCSLEPKNFLRVPCPLKTLLGSQNTPRSSSFVDAHYAHFLVDFMHSWDMSDIFYI